MKTFDVELEYRLPDQEEWYVVAVSGGLKARLNGF